MNRKLDFRTDFYSLGITFYELLCQKVPFESNDPLELLHFHLAASPFPPHEINHKIPEPISMIVMKLIAKNAEDRYQSAWGIQSDLKQCRNQLAATGSITTFPLAQHDIPEKFHIFQKLYGREKEINTMLKAFYNVTKGTSEAVMIGGYSGIGKTSLVKEIYKPLTLQKGYFITGKFDQFQPDFPYMGFIRAFSELIQQILTQDDSKLFLWKKRLLSALGANGQIIIDVIPEVELITGPQNPVSELGPVETQNRFNVVFQNFIKLFCKQEHPLVIFLDDMQWIDSGSLNLLELIISENKTAYLFFMGAYRHNEVNSLHPLNIAMEKLKQGNACISELFLSPLNLTHTTQLVADSLYTKKESVKKLSQLLLEKTGGNPFFMNFFLKNLYAKKLLMFNLKEKKWDWDLTKIKALGFTDNVLELMTKKIQLLDAKSQWILQIAACMGNQFDLKALSFILSHSPEKTLALLEKPIKEDLILPISDGYKMIEFNMQNSITDMNVEFKFSHDRIQQAVYSLLSESQKDEIHYRIGRHLLKKSSKNDISKIMISSTQKESMQSNMEKLDAASVMKISQAISGEIVFDRLLNKLMNIVIENAGAEKGFLILKSNKKMLIEAEAHAGQNNIQVLHSIPVKKKNNLSMAIINYVARTKKNLVLNNAAKEGMFTKDHYVMTNRPKSILCTPIMHKSNLTGILYLENNLLAGTFTDERLNMLQIVSSQIGISLENAKLYSSLAKQTKEVQKLNEQLEYRVTERTSALTASLAELNKTQGKLVQSEKMASLGELVSGIAHEINTPLGVIKLKYRPYQAIFKQNKPYQ